MNPTIVQTHPHWIKFLAAKSPYWVLGFSLPLFVLFLALSVQARESFALSLLAIVAGFLYWSLFEYLVHRYPYHTHFRHPKVRWFIESFHLYHHHNREDKRVLNSGPLMLYPLTPILLAPLWFGGLSAGLTASVGMGLVIYYVFYEFVHFLIHQKVHDHGYLGLIQKFHLYHHDRAWSKNFGNTLTLWDRLLGTYDPAYKDHKVTRL